MDPSAIDLDYGTGWTHVGYIASELCEYLHPLIAAGDIIEVYVQNIKYRVEFFLNRILSKNFIKRRGEWELVRPIRQIIRRREETTGHSVRPN
jgi:hypothetical protein